MNEDRDRVLRINAPKAAIMTDDQVEQLQGEIIKAVDQFMDEMRDRKMKRQDFIERTANACTLILNLCSIGSDALSVCTAAKIISQRMTAVWNQIFPVACGQVRGFAEEEGRMTDLLLDDTRVVFEVYDRVLDEGQMEALVAQFGGSS